MPHPPPPNNPKRPHQTEVARGQWPGGSTSEFRDTFLLGEQAKNTESRRRTDGLKLESVAAVCALGTLSHPCKKSDGKCSVYPKSLVKTCGWDYNLGDGER